MISWDMLIVVSHKRNRYMVGIPDVYGIIVCMSTCESPRLFFQATLFSFSIMVVVYLPLAAIVCKCD